MMRPGAVSDATRRDIRTMVAVLWPMAYDAPGGGVGRYVRAPCVRCLWHERGTVRVDERTVR
eukprot:2762335-Prymnesium_polylepis.1